MLSTTTIDQIKSAAKIADVIGEFVQLKKQGPNYTCNCPFHDEKTPSFVVNPVENFYKCFGCNKSGDSITFLQEYKKWTFQEAVTHLANKYKITIEMEDAPKTYSKPVWSNKTELSDKLVKWFEKERKISQKTLQLMRITESDEYMYEHKVKLKDESIKTYPAGVRKTINFNYFRNGELINIKYRDSIKSFKLFKNGELIFYNLDSLIDAKEVIFVEGENDVLALIECGLMKPGLAILSVPNGANVKSNNLVYLDSAIPLLDKVYENYMRGLGKGDVEKPIFHIGTDNDAAGRRLREDIAERLGKDKCDYIEWRDKKDANDVLIYDGIQAVLDCVNHPKEFPIVGAFSPSSFADEVDDMYKHGLDKGLAAGMGEFDKLLRFVPGYITVITGIPGHGKSDVVDQITMLMAINHGWKTAYYSPENKPTKLHISKLARKLVGKNWFGSNRINEQEKNQVMRFLEGKVYFIKPEKDFTLDSILDTVKGLKKQRGINCFVVDAWNRLEHKYGGGMNETKYINESLTKLDAFCETNNVHCFLVAHPTKMLKDKKTGNYEVPTLYNISGSAHFYNIVANGISIYRDFKEKIVTVYVQKVKFAHWGEVGYCEYKYEQDSGRFADYIGGNAIFDVSNWITKENRPLKMDIPEEDIGIITGNSNEEDPF